VRYCTSQAIRPRPLQSKLDSFRCVTSLHQLTLHRKTRGSPTNSLIRKSAFESEIQFPVHSHLK
jgi:hypothetical protein